jgi:hypothetical protein
MKRKENTISPNLHTLKYMIRNIVIQKFQLIEPGKDITDNFDINNMKLSIGLNFHFNIDNSGVAVQMDILNKYILKDEPIVLSNMTIITDFEISGMAIMSNPKDGTAALPDNLLTNLVSIAYSTARGIFFAKTQGSYLNQFFLPLIDPNTILNNYRQL